MLSDLLNAQKIDNIGIVRAYELYKGLPQNIQVYKFVYFIKLKNVFKEGITEKVKSFGPWT